MTRALQLLALLCLAAAPASDLDVYRSRAVEIEADALRSRIGIAIAEGSAGEWAGQYYAGNGLSDNRSLWIAPDVGWVAQNRSDVGLRDRDYGGVEQRDGRLCLSYALHIEGDGDPVLAPELMAVRWGERHYLVAQNELCGFCSQINMGSEPRADVHGLVLLRSGDEARPAEGWPELPPEWTSRLLAAPVEATVIDVSATRLRSTCGGYSTVCDTTLVLDAGRIEGLWKGLQLFVTQPESVAFYWLQVSDVQEHRAEAVLTDFSFSRNPGPGIGWHLSTRPPWRPMEPAPPAR